VAEFAVLVAGRPLDCIHWKPRLAENFDIYVAEVSSGRVFQLTSENGSNESPSWHRTAGTSSSSRTATAVHRSSSCSRTVRSSGR